MTIWPEILATVFWIVAFELTYPWIAVTTVFRAAGQRHEAGAKGFRRDLAMRTLPTMPGAGALYLGMTLGLSGELTPGIFIVLVACALSGLLFILLPAFKPAGRRIAAANIALRSAATSDAGESC
ncbi:MAG: hypothetical protein GC145_12270 [Caulobacter sp.]|nr:hypothetical protein [Caulobacter sp.]